MIGSYPIGVFCICGEPAVLPPASVPSPAFYVALGCAAIAVFPLCADRIVLANGPGGVSVEPGQIEPGTSEPGAGGVGTQPQETIVPYVVHLHIVALPVVHLHIGA